MKLSAPMTPAQLSGAEKTLVIPIYQRLFVWGEKQIGNLLRDLHDSCFKDKNNNKDYHLGVITIHEDEKQQWEIVDGQQRLTFLTLLGCELIHACKNCNATWADCWNKFVWKDEAQKEMRLFFNGRKEDRKDIQNVLETQATFAKFNNPSFERFAECFRRFAENLGYDSLTAFSTYCFNHAAFLVNELPSGYGAEELNLHFEKMNSTGKQLSPLEVVKGKWFAPLAARWNKCMNFDKEFTLNQTEESVNDQEKGKLTLADAIDKNDTYKRVVGKGKKNEDDIPSQSRLVMRPEILALHALCCLYETKKKMDKPLIQRNRLIDTFQKAFCPESGLNVKDFIEELEHYRAWVDKHIVFLQEIEGDLDYAFRSNAEVDGKDKRMMQFQAMLHVSSGEAQEWVLKAYLKLNRGSLSYDALREMENNWHNNDSLDWVNLRYGQISRYWFWKLDYLLWELHQQSPKNDLFKDLAPKEHEVITEYRFRENISIEHLHPQSKEDDQWGRRDNPNSEMHRFGNLAMMSQSGNSAQSDDGIGTKFGRVKDWISAGRLESIKMLLMFHKAAQTAAGWTVEIANNHEREMIDILAPDCKHQRQSNEPTESQEHGNE